MRRFAPLIVLPLFAFLTLWLGGGVGRVFTSESSPTATSEDSTRAAAPRAPAETAAGGGKIAFVSDRDGNREIYVVNADGSGLSQLTNDLTDDAVPIWSPDGEYLLFTCNIVGEESDHCVMKADGSGRVNLTRQVTGREGDRSWSPDGQRIAVQSYGDKTSNIYVVNADGSGLTNLTKSEIYGQIPRWSPDSQRLAFRCSRNLCVINADGSGLINLTNDTIHPGERIAWSPDGHRVAFDCDRDICVINADGSGPVAEPYSRARTGLPVGGFTWSPDGQRIVFATGTDIGIRNTYVYVMNADGSGLIALGEWPVNDCCPAWSPDGQRVAFVSERDGTPGIRTDGMIGIYVANADGSQVTQLTEVAAVDVYHQRLYEYRPVWSPDGRQITFASDTDGDWDIYVIDADGAGLINLTNSRADDYSPVWSPAP